VITKIIGVNLLIICFLHGIFASGFIPILNSELKEQASLAFSIYFAGIFIGQASIYAFKTLSARFKSYPLYEILFSFTLIFMGINLTTSGLIFGRFIEGLFAGMALPMLFALLVKLDDFMKLSLRIAAFNSIFSLGFVLGTPLIEYSIQSVEIKSILVSFGFLLIALSMLFYILPWKISLNSEAPHPRELLKLEIFKERFLGLFIAKTYYGLILALLSASAIPAMGQYSLSMMIILIAIIFILGQIAAVPLQQYFPKDHVFHLAPLFLAFAVIGMKFTSSFLPFLILTSFFHSILLFASLKNLGEMPTGARGFALYNAITDLGLVLGGLLSLSLSWGLPLFLFICCLPLGIFIIGPANQVRAERFYPFIGPLLFIKIFKRQKNPLLTPVDSIDSDLRFRFENPQSGEHKILLTGDLCPSPNPYQFSNDLKELINQHDRLYINLEGSQTDKTYSKANLKLSFDIPDDQLNALFKDIRTPISFSLINNHCFDRGVDKFSDTMAKLKDRYHLITSTPSFINFENLRIGHLGISYGVNTPWRCHPEAFFITPQQLLDKSHTKTKRLSKSIINAKKECDLLMLSYHWGYECEAFPAKLQELCSKELHELGVDLLWGHHCHIFQPFSIDCNKFTFFSTGNFISEMNDDIYKQGVLYSLSLSKDGKIKSVTPHFFELQRSEALISSISNDKLVNYQNIKTYF
jgi:MFS family permease